MSDIVISTKEGKPAYLLTPKGSKDSHTLCYELMFWRGGYTDDKGVEHESMWKTSGKYPATLSQGLKTIAQDIERNAAWKCFTKANTKSLREMADELEAILDGFSMQVTSKAGYTGQ